MGRLFDGVAAILGVKEICNYEGQAAILLEAAAGESTGVFPVSFWEEQTDSGRLIRFDWRPMIRELVRKHDAGIPVPVLAAEFMNTVVEMAVRMAAAAAKETGHRRVVLSGGSFQNIYIMKRLPQRLRAAGLEVFCHRRVSCNDEGLSLGQLAIAAETLKTTE